MKVLGIVGKSGSGKTTLIASLIGELSSRGFTISTIKHARDGVNLDRPGKDSYIHRQSGAKEVVILTASRWALLHELRDMPEPLIGEVIAAMTPVDILLVEGLREHDYECVEIRRVGFDVGGYEHPRKIGIASDFALPPSSIPSLDINSAPTICDYLLRHWNLIDGAYI